jgi:hypothetical protein
MRSYSDVPNRTVRLFLQEAGLQYDENRGFPRFTFRTLPPELLTWFRNECAYCGGPPPFVEEHIVPMNRILVGLHSWGNIVPACKDCNSAKTPMDNRGEPWQSHPTLDPKRIANIEKYIKKYRYAPVIEELKLVMEKLYRLTDGHTRSLVNFSVVAARPFIAGL